MRQAGFRYVFLGIENMLDNDLAFLKARAKNARRDSGRTVGNATVEAIEHLHRHGMYVVGGLIVGNPDDTRESIEANLDVCPAVHRLAVHPAPDAVPAHADDTRVPRARSDRGRGRRALRRHDRCRPKRACAGRRDRVPALAGRAVDEGAAHAGGVSPQPGVRPPPRPGDARAHVRGHDDRSIARSARTSARSSNGIESAAASNARTRQRKRWRPLGSSKASHSCFLAAG